MSFVHTTQRPYFERAGELALFDDFQVSIVSHGLLTNYLRVTTATVLSRDPGFTGTPYSFSAPASTSPVQLGVKKGDKIWLIGQSGGYANSGRVVTVKAAAGSTLQVYENLTTGFPTQQYWFYIMRRQS
jgi:hypothetical protein